jgi:hypothetical protein
MLSVSAFQANACTTDTPLSLAGQGGSNGIFTSNGAPSGFPTGVLGQIHNGGTWDGVAHLKGSADCSDDYASLSSAMEDAQFDAAALAAALSTPVWLEAGENFSISGGLGFSDGSTAVGATGLVRFGKNLSGFAGGAFNTDDTDLWAAKAGLRFGW